MDEAFAGANGLREIKEKSVQEGVKLARAQSFGQRGRGLHIHKHKDALLLARTMVRAQQKIPEHGGAQHLADQEYKVEGDTEGEGKEQPRDKLGIAGPPRIGALDQETTELET